MQAALLKGSIAFAVDPNLAGLAGIGDRLLAELVLALDLVIRHRLELGVVVELELGVGLADIAVVDPLGDVELLHPPEVLQHLDVLRRRRRSAIGLMVGSVVMLPPGPRKI